MMQRLRELPPQQRRLLMVGVPVVVVLALIGRRRGGDAVVTGGLPAPSAAVVGIGELSAWLSGITDQFGRLAERIDELENQPTPEPAPVPAPVPSANGPETPLPALEFDSSKWRTEPSALGVIGPQNTPTGFLGAPVNGVRSYIGNDGQVYSSAGWVQGAPPDVPGAVESYTDSSGQRWHRVLPA